MLTATALAFIGDAAYSLFVRKHLVEKGNAAGTLHLSSSKVVNAQAQARAFDALEAAGEFSDEEKEIARRAKNAHLHSRAKAATPGDYHKATALESVIGYLELTGEHERERELLQKIVDLSDNNG